jgi:hypothetical protein
LAHVPVLQLHHPFTYFVCGAAARTTPLNIGLRANADSYTFTFASLTVPANLGVLANDNYTESCAGNTAWATLLSVPVRGSVALDTDGGFVYTVTNAAPPGDTRSLSQLPFPALHGIQVPMPACLSAFINMAHTCWAIATAHNLMNREQQVTIT